MDASPEALIQQIEAAFADVGFDGVETVAELLDADDWHSESVGKDFRGRWQDLPDAWLEKYDSLYTYANPTSLRYYAPAVMCWTVREKRLMQSSEAFIGTLYRRGRGHQAGQPRDASFVKQLSGPQIAAIVSFLEWASWLSDSETRHSDCGRAYAVWRAITPPLTTLPASPE